MREIIIVSLLLFLFLRNVSDLAEDFLPIALFSVPAQQDFLKRLAVPSAGLLKTANQNLSDLALKISLIL